MENLLVPFFRQFQCNITLSFLTIARKQRLQTSQFVIQSHEFCVVCINSHDFSLLTLSNGCFKLLNVRSIRHAKFTLKMSQRSLAFSSNGIVIAILGSLLLSIRDTIIDLIVSQSSNPFTLVGLEIDRSIHKAIFTPSAEQETHGSCPSHTILTTENYMGNHVPRLVTRAQKIRG